MALEDALEAIVTSTAVTSLDTSEPALLISAPGLGMTLDDASQGELEIVEFWFNEPGRSLTLSP